MKILEIIPALNTGGAERLVVNLSNCLAKDIDVSLLVFYESDECSLRKQLSDSVKLYILKKHKGPDMVLFFRLAKFIRRNNYDAAHFHTGAISYCLLSAFCNHDCRHFATIHSMAEKEATGVHRLLRRIVFKLNRIQPITISNDVSKSFSKLYGINNDIIIPNGIPLSSSAKRKIVDNKGPVKFIHIANISKNKNQLTLARSFNHLAKSSFPVKYLSVGRLSTAEEQYQTDLLKEQSSSVTIKGEVSNPSEYASECEFFILASEYEGMPMSLLEAMAVGCVPLVTATSGCAEVIKDGYNGFFIASTSQQDIENCVIRALELSPEEYLQMSRKATVSVSAYSIDECSKKYVTLFNR